MYIYKYILCLCIHIYIYIHIREEEQLLFFGVSLGNVSSDKLANPTINQSYGGLKQNHIPVTIGFTRFGGMDNYSVPCTCHQTVPDSPDFPWTSCQFFFCFGATVSRPIDFKIFGAYCKFMDPKFMYFFSGRWGYCSHIISRTSGAFKVIVQLYEARWCLLMALQDEAKEMASLLVGGDWNHGIFLVNLWLIYG